LAGLTTIGRKGSPDIVAFLEMALLVPPDIPLIAAGIDQLASAVSLGHTTSVGAVCKRCAPVGYCYAVA
jgi:hypothetical protein